MTNTQPLSVLEDFLLLALDEQSGDIWPVSRSVVDCGTACAALMDLMILHRVDCDLQHLFVTNAVPTGDTVIDPVLAVLALDPVGTTRAIIDEIRFLADEGEALRERAMQRLVDRGVVAFRTKKILWIFGSRRTPVVDDRALRMVRLRLLNVVLGDEIPHPHDVALVALADACGLFHYILSPREMTDAAPRIAAVARMDILGRALAEAIVEVEASIAMASGLR